MKLNEIIKVPQQHFPGVSLSDFNTETAEQLTTAENIPLFHISGGPKGPDFHAYALKQGSEFVSFVIGKWGNLNGPAFYIMRTYTQPQYRNKGLITALYSALYRKLKYKLVSDNEMSPESISVWKKLSKVLPVEVYNLSKKETSYMKDVSDEELFGMEKKHKNIRLVLDGTPVKPTITDMQIPEKPLLGSILEDYIIYTNQDTQEFI